MDCRSGGAAAGLAAGTRPSWHDPGRGVPRAHTSAHHPAARGECMPLMRCDLGGWNALSACDDARAFPEVWGPPRGASRPPGFACGVWMWVADAALLSAGSCCVAPASIRRQPEHQAVLGDLQPRCQPARDREGRGQGKQRGDTCQAQQWWGGRRGARVCMQPSLSSKYRLCAAYDGEPADAFLLRRLGAFLQGHPLPAVVVDTETSHLRPLPRRRGQHQRP